MIGESAQVTSNHAYGKKNGQIRDSSAGESLLPRAEKMRREGISWRHIATQLRVSYTALHIWRKLNDGTEP